MTTDKIVEGNKLIAEFMGYKLSGYQFKNIPDKYIVPDTDDAEFITAEMFKYHTSFDWIMQVVEKIKDFVLRDKPYDLLLDKIDVLNLYITAPINTVWDQVVYFIQWYNKEQKAAVSDTTMPSKENEAGNKNK